MHTDTLKMAGGLGRTKEKPEGEAGDAEAGQEENSKGKRKLKVKRSNSLFVFL